MSITRRSAPTIVLLPGVMAVATIFYTMLSVLATFVIDDLGATRAELGWVVTVFSVTSAALSTTIGTIGDRLGARRAVLWVFSFVGVGFALMASARTLAWLMTTAVVVAIGQAMANPSTNKMIAMRIAPARRGLVTGVKQSGVQMGTFVGGLAFPALAARSGWRAAPLVIAITSGLMLLVAATILERDEPNAMTGPQTRPSLPKGTLWITAYAFLMGAGGSPIFSFLPLYAQEAVGVSAATAGLVVAIGGLVGLIGRIGWSIGAERIGTTRTMWILSASGVASAGALMAAESGGLGVLWVATVMAFLSISAWNAVAMLTVITMAGPSGAGRASGVVLAGFLAGLAFSPPIFGWSVDQLGDYTPGFVGIMVAFTLATVTMLAWSRRETRAADAESPSGPGLDPGVDPDSD